jgi:hypothetical protein
MRDATDELELKQQRLRMADFVSAPPDDLFEFTGSLQRFSQEIMPSVPRRRGPSVAYQSSPLSASSIEQPRPTIRPPERRHSGITTGPLPETGSQTRTSNSNRAASNDDSDGSIRSSVLHVAGTKSSAQNSSVAQPSTRIIRAANSRATHVRKGNRGADRDVSSPPSMGYPNDAAQSKSAKVGRYTMTLDAHYFCIHSHKLTVKDYAIGNAFFHALLRHSEQADAVVEALSSHNEEVVSLPGWLIDSSGVHAQADA